MDLSSKALQRQHCLLPGVTVACPVRVRKGPVATDLLAEGSEQTPGYVLGSFLILSSIGTISLGKHATVGRSWSPL